MDRTITRNPEANVRYEHLHFDEAENVGLGLLETYLFVDQSRGESAHRRAGSGSLERRCEGRRLIDRSEVIGSFRRVRARLDESDPAGNGVGGRVRPESQRS